MRSVVLSPCVSRPSSPPARGMLENLVGVEQGGAWTGRKDGAFLLFARKFQCRPRGLASEAQPVAELRPRGGGATAGLGGRMAPADPPQRRPCPPPREGPREGCEQQQEAHDREQDDRRARVVRRRTGCLCG